MQNATRCLIRTPPMNIIKPVSILRIMIDPKSGCLMMSPAKIISRENDGIIPQTQEEIDKIFSDSPQVDVEQVIAADADGEIVASITFGVKHMPVEDIHDMVQNMVRNANPPENVKLFAPAGNMAMGAAAVDAMLESDPPFHGHLL